MRADAEQVRERADRGLVVARLVAVAAALTAAAVLVGWATGRPALTTLHGGISMKPNTAVCLLLLAAALWSTASRSRRSPGLAASACAGVAAALGGLTLLQHLAGLDLRLDPLLFTEAPGRPATAAPGRMGPLASTSSLLLGTALAIRGRGHAADAAAQVMALATAFLALLPLVGYAYGATELFTIARYTGIALPTAVLMEAIAIAFLLVTRESGLASTLAGRGFPLIGGPEGVRAAQPAPSQSPPLRLLVVEDNVDAAETLREVLEVFGHEVQVSNDGEDGLMKALRWHPDAVLCDIGLPGIDGYGVARAIRADEELRGAVLIAVTGYASPADQQRAADAGFDHHLAKPADLSRLATLLGDVSRAVRARAPA